MEKTCQIDGCEKPAKGRNCQMHYLRIKKYGSPNWQRPTVEERFWASVNKTETCWLWTGAPCARGGYGTLNVNGGTGHRPRYAHRVSYELANGPIPEGKQIDHICHTPLCVNPEHLRPVDHKQNGENHQGALITSKSGVRGVYWHKGARKWTGQVGHNGVRYNAGLHESIADAEASVVALRNKLFTHNDIDRVAA
jgi:hypothetical protein